MIPLEKYIVRKKDVLWRMLDNEAFIISVDGNKIHTLNTLGSFIWQLTEGKNTVQQMVNLICERFEVSEKVAQSDANEFIEKLLNQGLVELRDTPGAE